MSHVTTIDLHIKDLDALALACRDIGCELRKGQETYRWFGKHIGDYPLPAGFKAEDLGKCSHAIAVRGNKGAYEVGVTPRRDGKPGFTLLWDFWSGGYGLEAAVGTDAIKLRNYYSAHVAAKEMHRKGFQVTIAKTEQGARVLCKK